MKRSHLFLREPRTCLRQKAAVGFISSPHLRFSRREKYMFSSRRAQCLAGDSWVKISPAEEGRGLDLQI